MKTATLAPAIRRLRTDAARDQGDGELLARFYVGGDHAAFAEVVRRHGPMVWGVCRRVLAEHDAEDAFQAVFLILALKGRGLTGRPGVGGWLHEVARHTAMKARASALTRKRKEALAPPPPTPEERAWEDARPLLDEELAKLPARFRAPIVLCNLGGKARREAACELGIPEGTLSSRLATGRRKLAARLARRGVSPALIPGMARLGPVPLHLIAPDVSGAVPAAVAALARETLNAMLLAKIPFAALAVTLALFIAGGGALLSARQAPGDPEAKKIDKKAEPPQGDAKPEAPATKREDVTAKLPALQKLKDAEAAYRVARREAAVELDAAIKKAEEAAARATKARAAVPPDDREGRKKATEAWRQAVGDASALRVARSRLDVPNFGAAIPPPPSPESRLHARLEPPSLALADQLGLGKDKGLMVASVEKDGPAAKAGLKAHDVLIELDGKPVPASLAGLRPLLAGIKGDGPVPAVVLRQGKREEIKAWSLPGPKGAGKE